MRYSTFMWLRGFGLGLSLGIALTLGAVVYALA